MSSFLANVSRLKPEIRLAQAISQFEADLSNEQKATFRTLKSQSLNSPPDPSDVMQLTAEMDRQMSRKAGGRCFGPRFTNFLQGVQQFAALGDVVVGGSQNIIACGVWSLVRMLLLSIVSFSSYVEKLSNLFMDIGRSAPRYQKMALLYPQSSSLQSQLWEYFIVGVGLCHHLFKFTQKSTFRQITSTLNDLDLKTFQTDLDRCASLIKEETILIEAQENHRFRALSSKLSISTVHKQKLATKLRVLDFCSMYDHETTWKQTRKVGNATLFEQLAEYQKWKDYSGSCTLLCIGKLGSGKSVLLANIVDDLNIYVGNDRVIVAYFFCRHDIPESLNARTILGSLARQLLRTISDLTMVAELCEKTHSTENAEIILELISRSFPPGHKAYFILDGLDECEHAEREAVTQGLQKIQEILGLLLLISFRLDPNNGLESITSRLAVTWVASISEDNPDIERFIEAELENCLKNRKLVIGDPSLILDIQDALLKGSQGMFLWVALQIQSLCDKKTDQDIRDALADLPKDLSETFSRILHKSGGSGKSYQTKILQLVVAAYRSLRADELREALSVVPGDAVWTPSRLLNDVYSVLASCGCLLIVDEEETTVRFVHHSVKQFLLSESNNSKNTTFTEEKAQRTMADIIVTYLNYGIFGTELSRTSVAPIMIQSTPSAVVRSAIGSSGTVQSLALKLLRLRKQPDFDISKTIAETRKPFQSKLVEEFHFYSYATAHWQRHIIYVSRQEINIYNLSVRLINQWVVDVDVTAKDWPFLAWAAENGNQAIIKLLIASGKVNSNSTDKSGLTLFWWAAENGHKAIIQLLLEKGADVESKDRSGQTLLSLAAANGYETVVQLLLEKGADVESKYGEYDQTPLSWAAWGGHEAVVQLLFERGANLESKDESGQTPLSWAAENGYETVVQLLLEKGADLESKDGNFGQTPLSWAAARGHKAIIQLLLEKGANLESKDEDGRTPLLWAAAKGHKAVVQLLLEKGADLESKDKNGQTPLSWATRNGHQAVVQLLLEKGADLESKDKDGRTPLSWAAARGHEAVVQLLQQIGIS